MTEVTITVNGLCDGSNHVLLTATVGLESRNFHMSKQELLQDPGDVEAALRTVLSHIWKDNNLNNNTPAAAIKAILEAKVFKL